LKVEHFYPRKFLKIIFGIYSFALPIHGFITID